ncbi:MAG TPA: hypothetical protein VHP12_03550 [Chitinophagaceae bacterium]|nr:hypothetical protein [Chitinophagaceae bacterium]
MKTLFFIFTIFICSAILSQNHFVRIYDNNKNKIAKGQLLSVTDSSIFISQRGTKRVMKISFTAIGYIRLRHSAGHAMLMTSLAVGTISGIIAAATAHNSSDQSFFVSKYSAPEGFVLFGTVVPILIFPLEITIGSIASLTVKKINPINGDFNNWQIARKKLNAWLKK